MARKEALPPISSHPIPIREVSEPGHEVIYALAEPGGPLLEIELLYDMTREVEVPEDAFGPSERGHPLERIVSLRPVGDERFRWRPHFLFTIGMDGNLYAVPERKLRDLPPREQFLLRPSDGSSALPTPTPGPRVTERSHEVHRIDGRGYLLDGMSGNLLLGEPLPLELLRSVPGLEAVGGAPSRKGSS